jgi:hypothetical protein
MPRPRRVVARWAQAVVVRAGYQGRCRSTGQRCVIRPGAIHRWDCGRGFGKLAASRVRLGYRRLTILLRREGWAVNTERIYRVYTEDRLTVHTKLRRKLARRPHTPLIRASRPNQRWSRNFVSAQLLDGPWFQSVHGGGPVHPRKPAAFGGYLVRRAAGGGGAVVDHPRARRAGSRPKMNQNSTDTNLRLGYLKG